MTSYATATMLHYFVVIKVVYYLVIELQHSWIQSKCPWLSFSESNFIFPKIILLLLNYLRHIISTHQQRSLSNLLEPKWWFVKWWLKNSQRKFGHIVTINYLESLSDICIEQYCFWIECWLEWFNNQLLSRIKQQNCRKVIRRNHQSTDWPTDQPIDQSLNQSITQSTNQPINQSNNQSITYYQ